MNETVQDREAAPPERPEGPERPSAESDVHWEGYPGETAAQSYTVPAGARYGLLFAILILALMMLGVAFMTMNEW
jgi:hypothetical protein